MKLFKTQKEKIAYFIVLLFTVFFVYVISTYDEGNSQNIFQDEDVLMLTNGWTANSNDGNSKIVSLPTRISSKDANGVSISRQLPDKISQSDAICFKSIHSRVCVLVDNAIVYSFAWDDDILLGNTPGSVWNVIELKPEYAGKTLTITTYSKYSRYSGLFGDVVYGSKDEMAIYMLNHSFFKFVISCIPLFLGIMLMIIVPFVRNIMKNSPLIYVGLFLIDIGIWEITESDFMQFISDKVYTLQILNLVSFALIPTMAIMAVNSVGMIKANYKKIIYSNIAVYAVFILTQLIGVADFFQCLWIVHLCMVIDFIVIYYDSSKYYTSIEHREKFFPIAFSYMIIIAASVVDIYKFYVYPESGNGSIMRFAIIAFILAVGINSIHASLKVQRNNIEKETFINMAYTDNLTGINNRRCFEEDAENLVNDKKSFNVVAIDMNNLKRINDELGHKYGDEALIKVAKAISVFTEFGEKCYRMGGDEFEVVCTQLTCEQIEEVCISINEELGKTEYFPGVPLAIAYGYFRFSANTDKEINKILAQADKKMYEKKAFMKSNGYATRG